MTKSIVDTDTFLTWRNKINDSIFDNPVLHSFDYDLGNSTGTTLAIIGGNYVDNNTVVSIVDGDVTLTANGDNFIVLNGNTGALEVYTTQGSIPVGDKLVILLYKFTLDEFETTTAIIDYRTWLDTDDKRQLSNINAQTGTSYTLVLSDRGGLVKMNNAAANTLTVPLDASLAIPINTILEVYQEGVGATTIAPEGAVVINSISTLVSAGQYSIMKLMKIASDEWVLTGDIT